MDFEEMVENLKGSVEQAAGGDIAFVNTLHLAAVLKFVEETMKTEEEDLPEPEPEPVTLGEPFVLNIHLAPDHRVQKVGPIMEIRTAELGELEKEIHDLRNAVLRHHYYEGQDRCHDIDDELYEAFGLEPKGKPKCTREEWLQGCLEYADKTFGPEAKTEAKDDTG